MKTNPPEKRRSDNAQSLRAGSKIATARILALQFDRQPEVIHGIRIAQCIFQRDLVGFMQVKQRLIEGHHTELARLLHHIADLMYLTLEDQLGYQW